MGKINPSFYYHFGLVRVNFEKKAFKNLKIIQKFKKPSKIIPLSENWEKELSQKKLLWETKVKINKISRLISLKYFSCLKVLLTIRYLFHPMKIIETVPPICQVQSFFAFYGTPFSFLFAKETY